MRKFDDDECVFILLKNHTIYMKSCYLIFLLFVLGLVSCSDEKEPAPAKQTVQFSFTPPTSSSSGGRVEAVDLPEGSSLLLSVTDPEGNPIFTFKKVKLLTFGSSVITEPVELPHGSYKVSDFILVDENENAIYATPKKNSPLSAAVTTALPFYFRVSRDKVNNVTMDVIDATSIDPEEFGYASFNLNVVNPLRLSVFVADEGGVQLTDAVALFVHPMGGTIQYELDAKVNVLNFTGDTQATYSLKVFKAGYEPYVVDFNYSTSGPEPVKVILARQETHTFSYTIENTKAAYLKMYLAPGANLRVDWGDNQFTQITNEQGSTDLDHTYEWKGTHTVTITGDLSKIAVVVVQNADVSAFGATHLTGLERIYIESTVDRPTFDLLNCPIFTEVEIAQGEFDLILPKKHHLLYVKLSQTTHNIDAIIENVYRNTVATGDFRRNGIYRLIGASPSPSPVSIEKLEKLRDVYNWSVEY